MNGSMTMDGSFATPTFLRADFGPFLDLGFINNSARQAYQINISLAYDHQVNSDTSIETGMRSDIDLELDDFEIFNSKV